MAGAATLAQRQCDLCQVAHDLGQSKLICAKPVAGETWRLDSVSAHWDDLVLRSAVLLDEHWIPYQEARLEQLLPLGQFLEIASIHLDPTPGARCVPWDAFDQEWRVCPPEGLELELVDPRRDRVLTFTYRGFYET